MAEHHALERTSPKGPGQKFVGFCIKCGRPGLTFADRTKECENPRGLSADRGPPAPPTEETSK